MGFLPCLFCSLLYSHSPRLAALKKVYILIGRDSEYIDVFILGSKCYEGKWHWMMEGDGEKGDGIYQSN